MTSNSSAYSASASDSTCGHEADALNPCTITTAAVGAPSTSRRCPASSNPSLVVSVRTGIAKILGLDPAPRRKANVDAVATHAALEPDRRCRDGGDRHAGRDDTAQH